MQSDVAREGFQDDFTFYPDKKYSRSMVRPVHVISALLALSYLLIVVLFVISSTNASKLPQQVKSNDTAVVLAAMKSIVEAVSTKAEPMKSDFTTDLSKLRSEVQTSGAGQRSLDDQITTLQNKFANLLSKMTDLENSMKKDLPVQYSTDCQRTIGDQMKALQNIVATLLSKMTDLQHSMKKDLPGNPCETGPEAWEYYGGSCYLFLNVKSTWISAKMKCESKNATLAIITSEGEQSFLAGKTRDQGYWIGLTDMDKEKEWRWIDGTDYQSSIKFWIPNEPNDSNSNEDCGHLWTGGEWNDVLCTNRFFTLCEKKASTE